MSQEIVSRAFSGSKNPKSGQMRSARSWRGCLSVYSQQIDFQSHIPATLCRHFMMQQKHLKAKMRRLIISYLLWTFNWNNMRQPLRHYRTIDLWLSVLTLGPDRKPPRRIRFPSRRDSFPPHNYYPSWIANLPQTPGVMTLLFNSFRLRFWHSCNIIPKQLQV